MKNGQTRKKGLTATQLRQNIQKSFTSKQARLADYVKPNVLKPFRDKENIENVKT